MADTKHSAPTTHTPGPWAIETMITDAIRAELMAEMMRGETPCKRCAAIAKAGGR